MILEQTTPAHPSMFYHDQLCKLGGRELRAAICAACAAAALREEARAYGTWVAPCGAGAAVALLSGVVVWCLFGTVLYLTRTLTLTLTLKLL